MSTGLFDDVLAQGDAGAATPSADRAPTRITVRPKDAEGAPDKKTGAPSGGYLAAGARGFARGVTADWYDEISGAHAASGVPTPSWMASPLTAILGAGKVTYESLAGQRGPATEAYETTRDETRRTSKALEEEFPGTTLAGQFGGGMVVPAARAVEGVSIGGRALNAAVTGGLVGGVTGAGQGENLTDRAVGGAVGSVVGGGLGAVAAPVIEGATALAGRAVRPITNAYRGLTQTDDQAARMVGRAHLADESAGANRGLTEAEYAAAQDRGMPVAVVDRGDSNMQALARWSANVSPNARSNLERMTDERYKEQTDRATALVRSLVRTPGNAHITRDALEEVAKTARAPFYNRAWREGSGGIWNDEIAEFAQAPAVQDAVKAATKQAQNRSARDIGQKDAVDIKERWLSPAGKPTLEFWDLVKRQLDQGINVAKREGRREDVMELEGLRQFLIKRLDEAVPSYPVARGVAAGLFGASNALEAGELFVTTTLKNEAVRRAVAKMNPEERDLFAEGFVSKFIEKANEAGDRRNILNQILQSPAARERFEIALGSQRFNEMQVSMRVEHIMDRMRGALGNSTTARQLMEAGAFSAADFSINRDIGRAAQTGSGWFALRFALKQGSGAISRQVNQRVAERIGEMLASGDQRIVERGVQLASRNPQFMRLLEAADNATARLVAQHSPSAAPQLQGPVAGRAEGEQQ